MNTPTTFRLKGGGIIPRIVPFCSASPGVSNADDNLRYRCEALVNRWRGSNTTSPIGALHAAGINDATEWCANELAAAIGESE